MSNEGRTIEEVAEYGPILLVKEGNLITVNGSYFNLWYQESDTLWVCVDCRSPGVTDGENQLSLWEAVKVAENWIKEIENEMNNGLVEESEI